MENDDVVGAAPTGDAPITSEWSTISLPTLVRLILEVWRHIILHPMPSTSTMSSKSTKIILKLHYRRLVAINFNIALEHWMTISSLFDERWDNQTQSHSRGKSLWFVGQMLYSVSKQHRHFILVQIASSKRRDVRITLPYHQLRFTAANTMVSVHAHEYNIHPYVWRVDNKRTHRMTLTAITVAHMNIQKSTKAVHHVIYVTEWIILCM